MPRSSSRIPRLILTAAVLGFAAVGLSQAFADTNTRETLVLNSAATLIKRKPGSHGFSLHNNGPNRIWCAIGQGPSSATAAPLYTDAGTVVENGGAQPIAPNGDWSGPNSSDDAIWCIADTADQVHKAATIDTEGP